MMYPKSVPAREQKSEKQARKWAAGWTDWKQP